MVEDCHLSRVFLEKTDLSTKKVSALKPMFVILSLLQCLLFQLDEKLLGQRRIAITAMLPSEIHQRGSVLVVLVISWF